MLWIVAIAALAIALWNTLRMGKLKEQVERIAYGRDYLENSMKELRQDLQRNLEVTRRHLARVNQGEKLNNQMILDGLPWADLIADQVQEMLAQDGAGYHILDVRTPGEFASGHLKGAQLIPVDELDRRAKELPKDRTAPIIVHCQSGSRSVAACEFLASQGYSNLFHMANGIGAWRGEIER